MSWSNPQVVGKVAGEVRHQNVGCEALFLEQFSHGFHSRVLVASSLDQKIENLAFIVDRPPQCAGQRLMATMTPGRWINLVAARRDRPFQWELRL